jgi:hypothetical protein
MAIDFNRALKRKFVEEMFRNPSTLGALFTTDDERLRYQDLCFPYLEQMYQAAKADDSDRFWSIFSRVEHAEPQRLAWFAYHYLLVSEDRKLVLWYLDQIIDGKSHPYMKNPK